MSWLDNFKIIFKIGLIVALLTIVVVGSAAFAIQRMYSMDEGYSDLISRVDKSTTLSARASRRAEAYLSAAFQLAAEVTDAGNVKYLAQAADSRKDYEGIMAQVVRNMPENASILEPLLSNYAQSFVACDPAIKYAASTSTPEQNFKAAARLKAECVPLIEAAIASHAKVNDSLIADAARISDVLTARANSAISGVTAATAAGLLVSLALALWIGTAGLSRPISELKTVMEALARKNFAIEVPSIDRRDEIGDMARTVEVFKSSGLAVERMTGEQQATERRTAAERKAEMLRLASDFEGAVGEIIETVSAASTELEASADTLSATAARAQQTTSLVAAASEEASANVQSVASATEEMASSVNEISRQVQESSRIAQEAVDQARKTNDRVGELAKAAARIGDVVELINTIAGQTNLLALNATIEAARAGDAGRGFAVVASEVKALAEQTARATGEISAQISGIQNATQDSVGAIREIGSTIGKMSEIASTIAAAVEEQGAATQEISRNIQMAAQGTTQVSANIGDVQLGASETGSASAQVLSAAQFLSRDSARLKAEVGRFLSTVRAA
ncbi:HAMP domain-containing methyl-accepting chemotaxis protein [Tardiphaga sp.]|uniref:methyl-accepting chemotaxis protein n=1 Tax=Tardiphaga sp. TaxID=1926292 RepID=UPI0025FAF404|nr:HAMP domain-containing methyl-accepting chemotaxis protein [Tardiphaga sp.]